MFYRINLLTASIASGITTPMKTTRPLPGHPYHGKTDAELRYIVKDASEAAQAMRDHNPVAEAKYLDQVNDACTILNYRGGRK